ncbi:MAG TPA: RNA-binding domain-containing protein [Dongiaceae bacterium]|nr:RNA-binding domain-containing protein [Dongiaceae bacterium]
MSMDIVRKRIAAGENETTEFKLDNRSTTTIAKVVCGFLNCKGGTVYIGVTDEGQPIGVSGSVDEQALALELSVRTEISPRALFSAEVINLDDRRLIAIEVPEGKDKPYVIGGRVWLRTKDGKQIAASGPAIRDLVLARSEEPERWERRASPSMSIKDLDHDEVRTAVREIVDSGRFKFAEPQNDTSVLSELSAYDSNGFTNAGDLLFSRTPFRRHRQCRVQMIRFAGEKWDSKYLDNRWFEGSLVRICNDLVSAIRTAVPVRSTFEPGEFHRVDRSSYDLDAIREGVVNAFVHRDYSAYSGGLRISIYDNRIEIWNSGRLPDGLTPAALRSDHPSILNNPDIAHVFYLRSLMERIGRGTEKIVRACAEIGATPPIWSVNDSGVTLTLYGAANSDAVGNTPFNERQQKLVEALQKGDEITPKQYKEKFAIDVTARQARRDLEELEKRKVLRRSGKARAIVYRFE